MARPGVPHPGVINTIEDRRNLEFVQYQSPSTYLYFEFDVNWFNAPVIITTIPAQSIILAPVLIRVTEDFDGADSFLALGLGGEANIGLAVLTSSGITEFIPNVTADTQFLAKTESDQLLYVGIFDESNTRPATGRGWAILQYLNLVQLGET